MRLLIISIFLAVGLIIFEGIGSLANEATKGITNKEQAEVTSGETTHGTTVISGEVTDIQNDTLLIKDEKGNIQSIKLSGKEKMQNLKTKDLKVGDKIHAQIKDGQLVSFYKEDSSGMKNEMKENTSTVNTKESKETTGSGAEEMGKNIESTAGGKHYTVRRGDTLAGIAQKTLGSSSRWREIAQLNGISNPNVIRVGERLILPQTAQTGATEEGIWGTKEKGTKDMKGNTGIKEEGTKGDTETTPEQTAPSPSNQGTTGINE